MNFKPAAQTDLAEEMFKAFGYPNPNSLIQEIKQTNAK